MIRPLKREDIPHVALIHQSQLDGVLSKLGKTFLTKFYQVSLNVPELVTYTIYQDEQILGFASFCTNPEGLYKKIILQDILGFSFSFLQYFITHPLDILPMIRLLSYPGFSDNDPELLSIAILPKYRSRGLGKQLFNKVATQAKLAGSGYFKVSTYQRLPANSFYLKMGCRLSSSFVFGGEKMNYYICKVK